MNAGALEAVDRILNRGGEPVEVVGAVVRVLHERLGGRFVRVGPVEAGSRDRAEPLTRFPIVFRGGHVADLEVAGELDADARATLERVALLVSPYAV